MGQIRLVTTSAAFAAGILVSGVALAHVPEVQVFRGGQSVITETSESAVAVFRGSPAAGAASQPLQQRAETLPGVVAISGAKLWLVDRESGSLRVCQLIKTAQVGEHKIDCQTGALPR